MNVALKSFLVALAAGFTLEKAVDASKSEGGEAPTVYQIHKAAGPAVQALRIQNGISEGVVMKALQLDPAKPADIATYMSFERGDKEFEMSAEAISLLAKTLKTDPATLAAKMLAADPGGAPEEPADPADPANPNPPADPNNPAKGGAPSGVIFNLGKKLTKVEADELNKVLLKSQQVKNGSDVVQKSADDIKVEKRFELGKTIAGLTDEGRTRMEKSGIIVPTDIAPGGTLNPTLGTTLLEIIQPQMAIVKDVQIVQMTSFNQEVLVMAANQRTAVRLTAGTEPTTSQMAKTIGLSKTLSAHDVDLVFFFDDANALQYQNNLPDFDNKVTEFFTKGFSYQFEDLGFNGTTDTYDGSTFTTLGKGWITTATAAATGGNAWRLVDSSTATLTTVMGRMDAMIDALATNNPTGYTMDHVFIMSFGDYKAYEAEYIAGRKSDDVLVNGAPMQYKGHKFRVSNAVAVGYMLFTRLDNMIFGYVNGGQQGVRIQRDRKTKGTRTIISIAVDYDWLDLDSAIVNQP